MPGKIAALGRYSFLSLSSMFKLIAKHWYIFIFILIILPSIIASIHTAIETDNPLHPFLQLGKRIFNADLVIKEDLETLKTNPDELVGMAKPENGIWKTFKYGWFYFLHVIYTFFTNIYLIFFPAVIIYQIVKLGSLDRPFWNWLWTIIIFGLYLFVINVIFVIYNIAVGKLQLSLPQGTEFMQGWYIFKQLIPLNGLYSFFKHIFIIMFN